MVDQTPWNVKHIDRLCYACYQVLLSLAITKSYFYIYTRSQPERFVKLGIDPPKGVLLFGPPGTGKTLLARAVANRTDACFIRVIGSELVQKYVGEGARMVRELFEMARSKKACIIFFDEIDAIGGESVMGRQNQKLPYAMYITASLYNCTCHVPLASAVQCISLFGTGSID